MRQPDCQKSPSIRGRPFNHGNPGRPRGSRNRTTRLNNILSEDERNEIIETGIRLAKEGDAQFLKFFLERLIPKEPSVTLSLPSINDHQDVLDANNRIIRAVSAGEILPSTAAALTAMVANIDRTLSDAQLEDAIARDEDEIAQTRKEVNSL